MGCPEARRLGVYDYTNRRLLLFVDKQTGAYAGACQLPDDAPQRRQASA